MGVGHWSRVKDKVIGEVKREMSEKNTNYNSSILKKYYSEAKTKIVKKWENGYWESIDDYNKA